MITVGKAVIGFVLEGTYACDSMWIIFKARVLFILPLNHRCGAYTVWGTLVLSRPKRSVDQTVDICAKCRDVWIF